MNGESEYLFRCKTTDAYIFKILTELLHNIIKTACFEISAKKMILRMMDSNRRTLIDLALHSDNFNLYYFSPLVENGILNIGLNLNHFYKMLKSIKKRDHLFLFIEESNPTDLGIHIIPRDQSRVTKAFVKIQNIQNLEIALPDAYDHSILVASNEFSKMCKDMFNMSSSISITTQKYSIGFLCNVGSVYSREVILGETAMENENNSEGFTEDYDTEQLSRILKISGLHSGLVIKSKKNMPLQITSNVGILGEMSIFIKSKRQLEDENMQMMEM
jgi:proliferating cell nuclear antigen PCNA